MSDDRTEVNIHISIKGSDAAQIQQAISAMTSGVIAPLAGQPALRPFEQRYLPPPREPIRQLPDSPDYSQPIAPATVPSAPTPPRAMASPTGDYVPPPLPSWSRSRPRPRRGVFQNLAAISTGSIKATTWMARAIIVFGIGFTLSIVCIAFWRLGYLPQSEQKTLPTNAANSPAEAEPEPEEAAGNLQATPAEPGEAEPTAEPVAGSASSKAGQESAPPPHRKSME